MMDLNALVELVYQEIVQKVESRLPSACIISDKQEKELEQILVDSYQHHYFSEENRVKDYEMTVIPRLTVTMLSNLANGIGSNVKEQFVLSQLLQGKKVVILQNGVEYYRYKSSSPVLLYKQYEEFERKVKGYGVLFLRNDELLGKKEMTAIEVPVVAEERMEVSAPSSRSFKLSKKLISEVDLQKLYLQNVKDIIVGDKCIMTPLAQDFIRTHQLTIIRERGNS